MATVPFGVRDKRTFPFVITPLYVVRAVGAKVTVHGKEQTVTNDIIAVYVAILAHRNRTTNLCNPSMDRISREIRMTKRLIVRAVRWLRELKMMETKPCTLPSGRTGQQYDFIDPPDVRFPCGTGDGASGAQPTDLRCPTDTLAVPMRNLNHSDSENQRREPDFAKRWGMGDRSRAWDLWMAEHGKPPPSESHLREWWCARA